MAADDDNRLGGPPGLYDSPNWEREGTGGIVQRIRVPPAGRDDPYSPGVLSLNDSDDVAGVLGGGADIKRPATPGADFAAGIPCRMPLRGPRS